jgi:hypothetical protein
MRAQDGRERGMGTGRLALEGRVDFFPLWVCSFDLGMSMVLARRVSDRRIRLGRVIIITTLAPRHHLSSPCLLRATTISRHVVSFSGRGILSGPRLRISFLFSCIKSSVTRFGSVWVVVMVAVFASHHSTLPSRPAECIIA